MDMRIPVVTGGVPDAASSDVSLFVAEGTANHATGCDCCMGRSVVGTALGRLFLARTRGETPWFTRVVATCETAAAEASLRAALASDPIASARFRPAF